MRNWRSAIHKIVPSTRCREAISIVPYLWPGWLWHPWNHNKRQPVLRFVFCCSTCKFYCCLLPLGSYPNFYDPKHQNPSQNLLPFCGPAQTSCSNARVVTKVQSSSININSINTFPNTHSQVSLFYKSWIHANTACIVWHYMYLANAALLTFCSHSHSSTSHTTTMSWKV